MEAGYSGTPLLQKLGIKEDSKIQLLYAPDNYFDLLKKDIKNQLCKKNELPDIVHLFAKNKKVFETGIQKIMLHIKPTTVIWVSWYKKSAGIPTDITETDIRNYILQHNLVDIKVCAVSEQWSGLKMVVPVAKRKSI